MVTNLLLGVGLFAVLLLAMSIGLFFGRPRLRGSCGGVAGSDACSVCGASDEAACRKEEAH